MSHLLHINANVYFSSLLIKDSNVCGKGQSRGIKGRDKTKNDKIKF